MWRRRRRGRFRKREPDRPFATRELARLQSILEVLKAQRDILSKLSDITALRALEESVLEALDEARKRGVVPQDPVVAVRADWQRLVRWSNQVQGALKKSDGIDAGAHPSLADLRRLKAELEAAPASLQQALDEGRRGVRDEDWSEGRPYAELTEVADAMGWGETLELAEPPGPWAEGVPSRARPLVATRMATNPGSPMLQRLIESLRYCREFAFDAARLASYRLRVTPFPRPSGLTIWLLAQTGRAWPFDRPASPTR